MVGQEGGIASPTPSEDVSGCREGRTMQEPTITRLSAHLLGHEAREEHSEETRDGYIPHVLC